MALENDGRLYKARIIEALRQNLCAPIWVQNSENTIHEQFYVDHDSFHTCFDNPFQFSPNLSVCFQNPQFCENKEDYFIF